MSPRRLAAVLAILALLVQALAPLGPARAEGAVICGAGGPVVVLIDLATGRPVAPLLPAGQHDCCLAGVHCGTCTGAGAQLASSVAHAATVGTTPPARALACPARAWHASVRTRAPPAARSL